MTKLLDSAIAAIKSLPDDRQDLAADVLLAIAEQATPRVRLGKDQIAEVELARAEAREGKFASDENVDALWKRFGA